jgi:hypothetical protein
MATSSRKMAMERSIVETRTTARVQTAAWVFAKISSAATLAIAQVVIMSVWVMMGKRRVFQLYAVKSLQW